MVEQYIVDILVKKINTGALNPVTNQPFKVDDIKIQEYKTEVQRILGL